MVVDRAGSAIGPALGPTLRRAWVGYRRLVDAELVDAGFTTRGAHDGRILRQCSGDGSTIAEIGRALGVSRQAAAKLVGGLRERGYVLVEPSPTSGREKVVEVTTRGAAYRDALRTSARTVEARLRRKVGPEAFTAVAALADAVGGGDLRLADYVRDLRRAGGLDDG